MPLVPEAVAILTARQETAADGARFVFPASRADSKLGHMSGERKAWLRLLERDEIAQLRQRIEAKGGRRTATTTNTRRTPCNDCAVSPSD